MHRAAKFTLTLTLLAISLNCFADGIDYGVGGVIFLIPAIILVLFILIGGLKGFVIFLVIFAGFMLYANIDHILARQSSRDARKTISDACLREAGNVGTKLPYAPDRILVRVAEELTGGGRGWHPHLLSTNHPADGVEFITVLTSKKTPNEVYVDISGIHNPIKGADGWYVNGIQTTVFDATGKVVAQQTDYTRDYGWCLGAAPPESIERFLRSVIGRPIGLSQYRDGSMYAAPVFSPIGSVSATQNGRFYETPHQALLNSTYQRKWKAALLPSYSDCHLRDHEFVICRNGTDEQNSIDLSELSSIYEMPNTWISIMNRTSDSKNIDSLTIVERAKIGAVLQTWHIRFPRINDKQHADFAGFDVRGVAVKGRQFTADLVFSHQMGKDSEWFENLAKVSIELDSHDGILSSQ